MRFNKDAETASEAKEYLLNRARQLLVDDISFCGFNESWVKTPGVVSAYFSCNKTDVVYASHYILKQYRGSGLYEKIARSTDKPIITTPDCQLESILINKKIPYRLAGYFQNWTEYKAISEHYGYIKAKRSNIPYMNHIDEGLAIMKKLGCKETAMKAFCIHPIYQIDSDFSLFMKNNVLVSDSPFVTALAVEYRNVANSYLAYMPRRHYNEINLSPLPEVNQMLIADKIQNRKDFENNYNKYSNKEELSYYFKTWLFKLRIKESVYQDYKNWLS